MRESKEDKPRPTGGRIWWRRLYWLRNDWRHLRQLRWSGTGLYVGSGGIGDELLTTPALQALAGQLGRKLDVYTRHPELFLGNPNVGMIKPATPGLAQAAARWNLDLRHPCEWQTDLDKDRQAPPQQHIIAEAAGAAGVHGPLELRPRLYLSTDEKHEGYERIRSIRPIVAMQSSGSSARYYFANKEWGADRFALVAEKISSRFSLVQLGALSDPLLPDVTDCRGLTLRQSAAILANCDILVGQVGFLMHLARAVDCRSTIIYGGREHPSQSGYPLQRESLLRAELRALLAKM